MQKGSLMLVRKDASHWYFNTLDSLVLNGQLTQRNKEKGTLKKIASIIFLSLEINYQTFILINIHVPQF